MPKQARESTPADGGWLTGIRFLPGNLVLATAKAAGRAVRISQDGAFTVAKRMGRVATWSKEQVACSAKALNPLAWAKRPADKRQAGNGTSPAASIAPALPSPSNVEHRALAAPRAGSKAPEKAGPPAAKRVVDPGSQQRPPRVSPRSRLPSAPSSAIPPEVTPAEASAAVFATLSEKVMFARAMKDLASPGQVTRAHAAAVLGMIPHDLSVKALAASLARDSSAEVRKECVNALTVLGRSDGLAAVERALSDSSSAVRIAAVRGVYRLAGPSGASSLVRVLSDKDESVRRRAAVCIGWLGRADLTAELLPLLRSENAQVRLAALEAIENLKSPAAVDQVIELLEDPEESVQRRAFEVLRTVTGKQMGETFPEDEKGRQFLVARWRAWRKEHRGRPWSGPA